MSYPTRKAGKKGIIQHGLGNSSNHPNTLYGHSIGREVPSETSEKEAPHLASRPTTSLGDQGL